MKRNQRTGIDIDTHEQWSRQIDVMFAAFDAAFMGGNPEVPSRVLNKIENCHMAICKLRAELNDELHRSSPNPPTWIYESGGRFPSGKYSSGKPLKTINGLEVINYSWATPIVRHLIKFREFWQAVEFYAEYDTGVADTEMKDHELEEDASFCAWLWEKSRKGWGEDETILSDLWAVGEWYCFLVDQGRTPSSFTDLCEFDWQVNKQVSKGLLIAFALFSLSRGVTTTEHSHG